MRCSTASACSGPRSELAWRLRDRDDIRSILEAEVPLDASYIEEWASAWDVADRWVEARRWGTAPQP